MYRNTENPLRCPVNLYNFYLSKCPESVKKQNNSFYLQPEESCAWDSPVWYSNERVSRATLEEILSRLHRNERTPSSPSSNRDLDETISSDESADAKKKKASMIYTSVKIKEGESLIDVRRRVEKQLKKDFFLFDFWFQDHQVEDGETMKDFDIDHKYAKIMLEIEENSSGGRLVITGFIENLLESEDEAEAVSSVMVTEMNKSDKSEDEDEDEAEAVSSVMVTEMNKSDESEVEDEEKELQEIEDEITVKMEELAALYKKRAKISRKKGQGGRSKKRQMTAPVVQEAEEEDAVPDLEDGRRKVTVFCAGFCNNNGKPGARAGVGVFWGKDDARNISCRVTGIKQTTRTAEVQAATMAIREASRTRISDLQVNTDNFVFISVTSHMKKWKKKGWRCSRGYELKNIEDWKELDRELKTAEENNVNIQWKEWTGKGKGEATDLAVKGANL